MYDDPDAFGLSLIGSAILWTILGIRLAGMSQTPAIEITAEVDRREVRRYWAVLAALIAIHLGLALYFVGTSSGEVIDCFTFQRDAVRTLLHGHDPFGGTQANIYGPELTSRFYGPGMVVNGRVQVGFQYPPLTLFWVLPGYLLGDVRYSYILAVIASAGLLFSIRPGIRNLALAAIVLLSPLSFFVEQRCWTEPLVLMTLSATVYAAMKRRWWLPIALGLFLCSKQYNFLALPFLGFLVQPFSWKACLRLTGYALLVSAATVLPFAAWNASGLWHDLVLFHLRQPFRPDAMSFAVPFPIFTVAGPVLVIVAGGWIVRSVRHRIAMFAVGYGFCLLLFVSTSKQAFRNYYFLIGNAILLGVGAVSARPVEARFGAWRLGLRKRLEQTGRGNEIPPPEIRRNHGIAALGAGTGERGC